MIGNCPDCWERIVVEQYDEHKKWGCNPFGVPSIVVLAISEKFQHYDFAREVVRKMGIKYPDIKIRMPKGNKAAKELAYFMEAMELDFTLYKSGADWEAKARNRALISGIRFYEDGRSERIGKKAHLTMVFSGTSKSDNPIDLAKAALRIAEPLVLYKDEGKKKGLVLYRNNPKKLYQLGEGVQVLAP